VQDCGNAEDHAFFDLGATMSGATTTPASTAQPSRFTVTLPDGAT
jgi:hypothetical protein